MKKTIQTKIDPKDIQELEKEAKKTGHTISSLIRYIVKKFLKEQVKNQLSLKV